VVDDTHSCHNLFRDYSLKGPSFPIGGKKKGGRGRKITNFSATHPSLPPSLPQILFTAYSHKAQLQWRNFNFEAKGGSKHSHPPLPPSLPPSLLPSRFCALPTLTKPSYSGATLILRPKAGANEKRTLRSSSPFSGRSRRREGGREGGSLQWWRFTSRSRRRRGRD